ncbi:lipopolysaccharide biosynthesis protein [Synoicihabitans lomoniglobus]|uniref:Polysaccharide biosynthesis protein n=1 Tax=Synoicihabitans lomoniglobus TaxID=2909285 RepID=A0AAE9ZY04_9BACT|nr:hypothetical protein [Opitutaceae bacterium LMO-M01]WED65249.1 hypothetical protein PXH66_00070 [Opitutaceae bacterium LMO-M01]
MIPILAAQAVGLACGLAGVRVNSSLLPPEVLGLYGLFLTLIPLGNGVVFAGVTRFVVRHWAAASDRPAFVGLVGRAWQRRLGWLALAGVGTGVAMWGMGLNPGIGSAVAVGAAVFLSTALISVGAMAQSALQADRQHWRDLAVSAAGSVTRTFLPPVLFTLAGGAVLSLWTGFTLHAAVLAGMGGWLLLGRGIWRQPAPSTAKLPPAYEGGMFVVLSLMGWMVMGANRWFIAGYFDAATIGYFVLASGVGLLPAMVCTALLQYAQPGWFALGDGSAEDRRRMTRQVDLVAIGFTVAAVAGLLGLTALGPWLIGPLIAPDYAPALAWILPTGCFGLTLGLKSLFHTQLLASHREAACAPAEITGSVILLMGGWWCARLGPEAFSNWLIASPLVALVVVRPIGRWYPIAPSPDQAGRNP